MVRVLSEDGEFGRLYSEAMKLARARQYRWTRMSLFGYQKKRLNTAERLGFKVGASIPRAVYLDGSFTPQLLLFHDLSSVYEPPPRPYLGREPLYPLTEEGGRGGRRPGRKGEPEVRFRLAREGDAEDLARIFSSPPVFKFLSMGLYEGHMTPERVRGMMARSSSSGGFTVVAEDKETGRAVASAGLVIPREDVMSHVGDVGMSVAPEWQGRGLGTKLLGEIIRLARRLHLLKLVLSVFDFNERAIHLYRKTGFQPCGSLPGYLVDNYTKEIYMHMDL